jgi:ribosomal protein S18 acetylase RimI-like enzyme
VRAAAAIALRHAIHGLVCDEERQWAHGRAVRATDLPSYYTYNSVRVEDAAERLGADALMIAVDELQHGLAHRQVEVEDQAAGERLRPGFEARGWVTERLAWMALAGAPAGRGAATHVDVGEVPFARTRPLREAWFGSSALAGSPAARSHFLGVEERVATRRGTRALAAWGPGGDPLGFVAFSIVGEAAEVEQVYVVAQRRGHGTGAALVRTAIAAAGSRVTWIVADDEGDAKRLYERLGFATAWIQHVFTRGAGGPGSRVP